jgi:hypothetical protein
VLKKIKINLNLDIFIINLKIMENVCFINSAYLLTNGRKNKIILKKIGGMGTMGYQEYKGKYINRVNKPLNQKIAIPTKTPSNLKSPNSSPFHSQVNSSKN